MKITPIATGSGQPGTVLGNVEVGQSAGSDRKEAAKRAFRGEAPGTITEPVPQAEEPSLKKRVLKMITNKTPERYNENPAEIQPVATDISKNPENLNASAAPETAISDPQESEADANKPIAPQFAALARQKRALQVKERELAQREEALKTAKPEAGSPDLLAQLKADPLGVLEQAGVSYENLTEAILGGNNPQAAEIRALKAEVESLKKGVDTKFTERDTQAEKQVLSQMSKEAEHLASQGDTYELVRTTKSVPDVVDLIHRTWKKTGEVLDVPEAMRLVEDQLVEEILAVTKANKLQSKLGAPASQPQVQPAEKQFRTLTNRDGTSAQLSRRDRAMAAFHGQLKRE